jgi:sigma-B regulation protein RsbU (phosphoserine phosphatase)
MLRSTLGAAWRRGADSARVARELLAGIDFLEGATCATMIYAFLLPDGRVRFFNAGHPPLLCLRADAGVGVGVERFASTGPLLHSAFHDRPLPTLEITLAPGDRLLALTDGAFEARNPADQELGLEPLEEIFTHLPGRPAGEILDTLLERVHAHGAGRPVADDVTLVLMERTG